MVPTLLDIAKLDAGIGYPLIEEAVKLAPELALVPADTILGTTMELTVRSGLPTVRFRNANEGVARSKSSYETTRPSACKTCGIWKPSMIPTAILTRPTPTG